MTEQVAYYIIEGVLPWGKPDSHPTWLQDVRPISIDQPASLRDAWHAAQFWIRGGYTRVTIHEIIVRPAALDPADVAQWAEAERRIRETWDTIKSEES